MLEWSLSAAALAVSAIMLLAYDWLAVPKPFWIVPPLAGIIATALMKTVWRARP